MPHRHNFECSLGGLTSYTWLNEVWEGNSERKKLRAEGTALDMNELTHFTLKKTIGI